MRINLGFISTALLLFYLSRQTIAGGHFWTKTRNRIVGGSLLFLGIMALAFSLEALSLLPLFVALTINHLHQKQQSLLLENNLDKVSTLQAKIYKQTASLHNQAVYQSYLSEKNSAHSQLS